MNQSAIYAKAEEIYAARLNPAADLARHVDHELIGSFTIAQPYDRVLGFEVVGKRVLVPRCLIRQRRANAITVPLWFAQQEGLA